MMDEVVYKGAGYVSRNINNSYKTPDNPLVNPPATFLFIEIMRKPIISRFIGNGMPGIAGGRGIIFGEFGTPVGFQKLRKHRVGI